MTRDESTYGFSKTDASELVQLIGGADVEFVEGRVRGQGGGGAVLARTPTGGIAARTGAGTSGTPYVFGSAVCTICDPVTGIVGTDTRTIYNSVSTAIAAGRLVQAKKIGSRYFIDVDDCPADGPTVINGGTP